MAKVTITGSGSDIDSVIANLREQLDGQFGDGNWSLEDEPDITIGLSIGGQSARVAITLHVEGDRTSTMALPWERA